MPPVYFDVFTQFDAINDPLDWIPVSNGKVWGMIPMKSPEVILNEFSYTVIKPERWEHNIYFVRDKDNKKWGALTMPHLYYLMPCIAVRLMVLIMT